MLEVMRKLIN